MTRFTFHNTRFIDEILIPQISSMDMHDLEYIKAKQKKTVKTKNNEDLLNILNERR